MSNLSDFIINDGVLTKYVGTDPHVIIPEGVTQIGAKAFAVELGETSSLETVVLPSTLRVIEKYAFHSADVACCDVPFSQVEVHSYAVTVKSLSNTCPYKCNDADSIRDELI